MKPYDLLVSTLRLYRANFWLFVGYTAWLLLPIAVLLLTEFLPINVISFIIALLALLIQVFIAVWMAVCIIRSTVLLTDKKSVDVNLISTESLRLIQPVLIITLLQSLIIIGGIPLLIVPAIVFWVWFSMSKFVTILDNKRPLEALSTSRSLVKGRFFPVLWRLISGPFVIGLVYASILGMFLSIIASIFGLDTQTIFSEDSALWAQSIETIGDIFVIPLFIIYSVLLYEDLKKTQNLPLEKAPTLT